MLDWISNFLSENTFIKGSIFLIVGIAYLTYKILKKESFNMNNHGAYSWKALVNSWAIIFMLIVFGLILIFRN
jgi:hypothetical protein